MAMEFNIDSRVFGGLVGVIADSLGRKPPEPANRTPKRELSARHAAPSESATSPAATVEPGALARFGRWFLRQKAEGVDAEIARSRDIFESLDRWLWKQQMRETEAYLAQSEDIFDLERRMRRLERGPARFDAGPQV
jgi:Protein of unknown function (DUF3563)